MVAGCARIFLHAKGLVQRGAFDHRNERKVSTNVGTLRRSFDHWRHWQQSNFVPDSAYDIRRLFVLPEAQDLPACICQQGRGLNVPGNISLYFELPPFSVGDWHVRMLRTAVPEAAIDEDGDPESGKSNVNGSARSTGDLHTHPVAKALEVQEASHSHFRRSVPPAQCRHPPRHRRRTGWRPASRHARRLRGALILAGGADAQLDGAVGGTGNASRS
jgi:hypothetical protein